MKIISWNVNGIRAVERKGALREFLNKYDPDVVLLQEIKAQAEQLEPFLKQYSEYAQYYNSAEKPGYAGTGIWIRNSFLAGQKVEFITGMPGLADDEGRVARVDIGNFSIFGIYFPNGGKSAEAWRGKLVFYDKFLDYINALREEGRDVIWGGDVNCAHEEIDLARPDDNKKSIGFLPEERDWITRVVKNEWIDVFRRKFPKLVMYSWWHVITRARKRNVGWRIDYFFVDEGMMSRVQNIEYLNDQMGSDHCPVLLDVEC